MSNAIDRLSKIVDHYSLFEWCKKDPKTRDRSLQIEQIKEVVTLAKKNQQPSIDAMRFEAAKAAMASLILKHPEDLEADIALYACTYADKLIAELQKQTL